MFSWPRLRDADPILKCEMASTGEVSADELIFFDPAFFGLLLVFIVKTVELCCTGCSCHQKQKCHCMMTVLQALFALHLSV